MPRVSSHIKQHSVAVLLVLAALALTLVLDPWLAMSRSPFLLFFGAVMVSGWYGGIFPGTVATVLAAFLTAYFFMSPTLSLAVNLPDGIRIGLFVMEGLVISVLCDTLKNTQRWAEFNFRIFREREQALRSQSQAAIAASEARLQLALDGVALGVWEYDLRNGILQWSERCKSMFGLAPQAEVSYETFIQCIHPDDRARVQQAEQTAIAHQTDYNLEYRVVWQDGSIHWITDVGLVDYDRGKPWRLSGFTLDITDRKQAEVALRQSEERLRVALKNSPITVFNHDLDLRYTWIYNNPAVGLRDEDVAGKLDTDLLPREQAENIMQIKQQVLDTGVGAREEMRIPFPPGDFYFDLTIEPLWNADNEIIGLTCAAIDITERKHSEIALRRSESLLNAMLAGSPVGLAFFDRDLRYIKVNEALATINDIPLEQHLDRTLEDVLPKWAPHFAPILQQVMQTKAPLLNQEITGKSQAGVHRHCLASYYPVCLPDGQLLGVGVAALDITHLKQIEQALRESESRFKRLVESNVVGCIFWQVDGTITDANDAFLQMVGYDRSELQAGLLNWRTLTPPDQLTGSERAISQMRQNGSAFPLEKNYTRKDGSLVPVLLGGVMFEGSQERGVSFVIDLTEQKQTEAALRQSEERYRLLAEALPQFVWIADRDCKVEYCNPYWYHYTGLTPAQTAETDWGMVLHPDDKVQAIATWQQAAETGKSYEMEYRVRRRDGSYRWFLAAIAPLHDSNNAIVKWVGTAIDIDDRKQTEAEKADLLMREKAARSEAEAANRTKDEFLAVLSHELRTPLNPILGWARLLRQRQFDQQTVERALETIERNAKLQTQLIEDLLDVSRILRGKLSIHVTEVDLAATIEAALDTVQLAAAAKSIQLQTRLDPAVGLVSGDPNRLQQVIWNLLSNAVKFTPTGGKVEICLEREALQDDRGKAATFAKITVADTGKGIPLTFLPYVFDYFRQADGTTTRQFGGLGLGLAIARHLVELHGGTIQADSLGEGQGATFTVYLPLRLGNTAKLRDDRSGSSLASHADLLTGLKILVVEDDEDTRSFLSLLLRETGATVTSTASAQEALNCLTQFKPDLLLSDIGMPQIDGYNLIQQVRAMESDQPALPAIALTAYAGDTDQQQALSAGFQMHLAKPIDPNKLIQAIVNLIPSDRRTELAATENQAD
jgi:PAS domain S-box-containing protein